MGLLEGPEALEPRALCVSRLGVQLTIKHKVKSSQIQGAPEATVTQKPRAPCISRRGFGCRIEASVNFEFQGAPEATVTQKPRAPCVSRVPTCTEYPSCCLVRSVSYAGSPATCIQAG